MSDDQTTTKSAAYLPVYILVDTSGSMNEGSPKRIEIANQIVPAIVEVCQAKPAVRDKLRLGLLSFASDAKVVVPLGTYKDFVPIPVLTATGGTEYAKAFRALATEIETGVRSLASPDVDVFRPVVFMVTDGEPTDADADRAKAFGELIALPNGLAPHVVVFGVADASADTLQQYVNRGGKLVMAKSGVDASEALGSIVTKLVSSIVQSTVGANAVGEPTADGGRQGFQFIADDADDDIVVFD